MSSARGSPPSSTSTRAWCSGSAGSCSAITTRPRTPLSRRSSRRIAACCEAPSRASRGPGSPRSRATSAARGCAGARRRRWRSTASSSWSSPTRSDLAELADQREELAQLASEIAKLPSRQREALALRDFLGLSYEEVASTLSVSVPVVESLLFRARRRLRDTVRTVPRYAAGLVIVPLALRASVARDVPDFDSIGVGLGLAGVAGAAAGGVAKVLSIPASVKIAATVAVVATGSVVAPKLVAPTHHAAAPAAVVRVAEPDAGAGAGPSERSVDPPEPAPGQQAPAEPAASRAVAAERRRLRHRKPFRRRPARRTKRLPPTPIPGASTRAFRAPPPRLYCRRSSACRHSRSPP